MISDADCVTSPLFGADLTKLSWSPTMCRDLPPPPLLENQMAESNTLKSANTRLRLGTRRLTRKNTRNCQSCTCANTASNIWRGKALTKKTAAENGHRIYNLNTLLVDITLEKIVTNPWIIMLVEKLDSNWYNGSDLFVPDEQFSSVTMK